MADPSPQYLPSGVTQVRQTFACPTVSSRRSLMLRGMASLVALGTAGMAGCSQQPLRLGFLGGLTGPTSDLGIAGRDSTLLAIEQFNQRGGFQGQAVELVEFDDKQQPASLNALAERIGLASVAGVVGPMTSSVAEAWIPIANKLGLTTVSPTVTSSDFTGQDDQFFRVCSTTREYAYISAEHHVRASSPKRFALIRDDSNAAYTRSWAKHFADRVTALGGQVVQQAVFSSGKQSGSISEALAQALAYQPDAMVAVANARDTALLAQLLRKQGSTIPLSAAEWAATDQLLSMGGRAVDQLVVAQYFDPNSQHQTYQAFTQAFKNRFGRQPGFAEVAAFDAANVMLRGLTEKKSGEPLKQVLLRIRQFEGLQQPVVFDASGDASRPLFVTRVLDGRFRVAS